MSDSGKTRRPANERQTGSQPVREASAGDGSRRVRTRQATNWAWATPHDQYDWMDSHTLSGDLDKH